MARLSLLLAAVAYAAALPVNFRGEVSLYAPKMQGGIVRPGNKDLATRKVCFAAYKACSAKADEVADRAEAAEAETSPSMELLDAVAHPNKGQVVRPNNKNQAVRKVCYSAFKACMSKAAETATEKGAAKTDEEVAVPAIAQLEAMEMDLLASKPGRPDHNRNPNLHKGDNANKQPSKGTITRPADKQRAKAEKAAAAAGSDDGQPKEEYSSDTPKPRSVAELIAATKDKPKPGKPHKNPNMEKGENDAKQPSRGSIVRPSEKKRRRAEATQATAETSEDGEPSTDEPTAMELLSAKPGKPHPNPDMKKGENIGKQPKRGTIIRPQDKKEHKQKGGGVTATTEEALGVPAEEGEAAAEATPEE